MDPKTRLSTKPPRPEKTKPRRKSKKQSKKRPSAGQVRRQKAREPQVNEGPKQAMFIRTSSSGMVSTSLLRDLHALKKPDAVTYTRKNKIIPFEDPTSIEFFSHKNDCSLFALVSHTKKRPQNLVIGRLFDHHMLDMLEVGVSNYESIARFEAAIQPAIGTKPCILFKGSEFETDPQYRLLKSMWLDMLRGRTVEKVNLANLDHVVVITAISDGSVSFRHYAIKLKKSGSSLPRVELQSIGPNFDMTLRRVRSAANELMKEAMRQPKESQPKKIKNISTDALGKMGRIHMKRQDYANLQLRKMKGLKRSKNSSNEEEGAPQKRARE
mmetsp:Transcript_4240/g.12961  ORF Transcript_4240/g.12961 Transcript_4240/m.12961 type:complete len:326 (+) Transcript_4240:124-1101(+)